MDGIALPGATKPTIVYQIMRSPLIEITSRHFSSQISLEDPAERLAALEALRIRRDPELLIRKASQLLADASEEVRLAAVDALISVGGKQVGDVAGKLLETDDRDPRMAAAAVLAGIGRAGVGPALERLEHPSACVRAAAVWAIGKIGSRSVTDDVAALLGDADPAVITEAVRAVGLLNGTEFIPDLIVVYRRIPEVRLVVLETLAELDAHQSLDLFEAALQEADADLRRAALDGLRAADSPRAARILRTFLEGGNAASNHL